MKKFLALSLSDAVFYMLINVNMPTTVGILTRYAFVCLVWVNSYGHVRTVSSINHIFPV